MDAQTFLNNFGHIADAPNGVEKLRQLILEFAVKGKLVKQDMSDGVASDLVERLRKRSCEKSSRKRSGKSITPPLKESEYPFHLPSSWEWLRLDEAAKKITDGEHLSPKKTTSGMPLLTAKHVLESGVTMLDPQYVSKEDGVRFRGRCDPQLGDVLICSCGTIGRCCAVSIEEVFCLMGSVILVRPQPEVNSQYLNYFLRSMDGQLLIRGATKGMAVNALYLKDIRLCPVPLPPLEEQKRIVKKVDQLMALCDQLETQQKQKAETRGALDNAALDKLLTAQNPDELNQHWQRIAENFHHLSDNLENLTKLRAAIPQLAIQGKLVPQDPNDEPASKVLERIRNEMSKQSTLGKRKIKELDFINDADAPYELPRGWAWARFPELGEFGRGKSKHRPRNDPALYSGGKYPMVQTGDVARANGIINTYTARYNDKGLEQSRLWSKGTMCITIAANIADSGILGIDACFPDSVVGFVPSKHIGNVRYFEYFIRTAKEHLEDFAPSTAQKNINLGILETVLIPIPPKNEIERIVAKVDQLMILCDELEAKKTPDPFRFVGM